MDETMRNRFTDVTTRLLDEDPRVAVVLAVISADRFTTAAMRHPGRVVDVGIREQLLVSVAGGMASTGLRPVVHTIATFLVSRPYEQIKLDLGHQGFGAVLVSTGASYDYAESGRTHQAPEDVALLDTLQDWTVHVPGHADELEVLLRQAAAGKGNAYLRMSGQTNRAAQPVGAGFTVVRRGRGPVVVAVGPMLDPVLSAVEGTEATVLYAATVRPFDGAALRAVAGSVPDVVLVEPYRAGTSSQHVSEALRDRPHRLLALGVDDVELRRYGSAEQHAAAHGLDPAGIRAQVAAFVVARATARAGAARQRLKASLTFSAAFLTSALDCLFLPSASMSLFPVALPAASLALPTALSPWVLALSSVLMCTPSSSSDQHTTAGRCPHLQERARQEFGTVTSGSPLLSSLDPASARLE